MMYVQNTIYVSIAYVNECEVSFYCILNMIIFSILNRARVCVCVFR